jgi:hypothetical protein
MKYKNMVDDSYECRPPQRHHVEIEVKYSPVNPLRNGKRIKRKEGLVGRQFNDNNPFKMSKLPKLGAK